MSMAALREKGLAYLVVGPLALVLAFPFYVMVITAFKSQFESYDVTKNPYWFHNGPTVANASYLFHHTLYGQWIRNTALIALAVIAITLLLAVPAGYALARLSGRVGQSLGIGIFLTYLVPPTLLFLPLFWVISKLHLQDRLLSLILVYPSFTVPFSTWLLMGFF
jgi:multiple sugar transport system permease protein